MPYWIWLVLPRIFPEYLPGARRLRVARHPGADGHEMPIGLSKVTVGFPRVGINCAMCHTASLRAAPGRPADDLSGGAVAPDGAAEVPPVPLRVRVRSAVHRRHHPRRDREEHRLSTLDRLLYRFAIIPRTRRALRELDQADAWMRSRPDWGRGRIDPFNPVKFRMLRQPIDETIGNSDMMPLWNLQGAHGPRVPLGRAEHAICARSCCRRRSATAPRASGWIATCAAGTAPIRGRCRACGACRTTSASCRRRSIRSRSTARSPRRARRSTRASARRATRSGGARTGTVIPRRRRSAPIATGSTCGRQASAAAYNAYGEGHGWKFSHFRTTDGYVSVPLDGLWLTRARTCTTDRCRR